MDYSPFFVDHRLIYRPSIYPYCHLTEQFYFSSRQVQLECLPDARPSMPQEEKEDRRSILPPSPSPVFMQVASTSILIVINYQGRGQIGGEILLTTVIISTGDEGGAIKDDGTKRLSAKLIKELGQVTLISRAVRLPPPARRPFVVSSRKRLSFNIDLLAGVDELGRNFFHCSPYRLPISVRLLV